MADFVLMQRLKEMAFERLGSEQKEVGRCLTECVNSSKR